MRYREFFHIEISHQYFADEQPGMTLIPDESTTKFLKGQHFLVKKTEKGLKVLVPLNEEGAISPIITPEDLLRFHVFPGSGNFNTYTELPENFNAYPKLTEPTEKGNIILFTNKNLAENQLELTTSELEITENTMFNDFPAVAKIEIQASAVPFAADSTATAYRAVFTSGSVTWRYYFISDSESTGFTVQDQGDQVVTFNELTIPDDTSDQVASALRSGFPDDRLLVFESDTTIAYTNKPIKNIQLLQDGGVVIKHLPNPDAKDHGIQIIKIK